MFKKSMIIGALSLLNCVAVLADEFTIEIGSGSNSVMPQGNIEQRILKLEKNMNVAKNKIEKIESENEKLKQRVFTLETIISSGINGNPGGNGGWDSGNGNWGYGEKYTCESYCVSSTSNYIDRDATYLVVSGRSLSEAFNNMQAKCSTTAYTKDSYGQNINYGNVKRATPQNVCKKVESTQAKQTTCQSYCITKNSNYVDRTAKLVVETGFGKEEVFAKMTTQCSAGYMFTMDSYGQNINYGNVKRATLDNTCGF